MSDGSFLDLLNQAKQGQKEAVNELMLRFNHVVKREADTFRDQLAPNLSCQDIYQEVWLRVWSRLPGFKGHTEEDQAIGMLVNWLKITTRTVACNIIHQMNAQKRKPNTPIQSIENNDPTDLNKHPSSIMRGNETKAMMASAIMKLGSPEDEAILQMRYYEGKTIKVIAESTGISESSVRQRVQKMLTKLKPLLHSFSDSETESESESEPDQ